MRGAYYSEFDPGAAAWLRELIGAGLIPAETASGDESRQGVLNPAFSGWLMGYPPEWLECGARAMLTTLLASRSRGRKSPAGSDCSAGTATR